MNVLVNGIEESLAPPLTLSEYLVGKEINKRSVIIEFNGKIVKEENYSSIIIRDDDVIEVLKIVGGG